VIALKRRALRTSLAGLAVLAVTPVAVLVGTVGSPAAHPGGAKASLVAYTAGSGYSCTKVTTVTDTIIAPDGTVTSSSKQIIEHYPPPC